VIRKWGQGAHRRFPLPVLTPFAVALPVAAAAVVVLVVVVVAALSLAAVDGGGGDGGGWMWWWWLDVVGCGGCRRLNALRLKWMLPWELFGLFWVTRPLPSLNGTYCPNVHNNLALVV
jgi:hypothetical protein